MKLAVVIASVGRPALLNGLVARLRQDQTRPPDHIVVSAVSADDVGELTDSDNVTVLFSRPGACDQRNLAIERVKDDCDAITFFDDDYLPHPTYLAQVQAIFEAEDDIVGMTGRLIADGARGPGIPLAEAVNLIERYSAPPGTTREIMSLYGCNMSVRMSALREIRFDENLPLYAWQEDIDFSFRLGERGKLVSTPFPAGVHLGSKRGRTSGKRFGYSQVANIVYLLRKGTIPKDLAYRLLFQNVCSNMVKSLSPEPYIDRRGRLLGNFLACTDVIRGSVDPGKILQM